MRVFHFLLLFLQEDLEILFENLCRRKCRLHFPTNIKGIPDRITAGLNQVADKEVRRPAGASAPDSFPFSHPVHPTTINNTQKAGSPGLNPCRAAGGDDQMPNILETSPSIKRSQAVPDRVRVDPPCAGRRPHRPTSSRSFSRGEGEPEYVPRHRLHRLPVKGSGSAADDSKDNYQGDSGDKENHLKHRTP